MRRLKTKWRRRWLLLHMLGVCLVLLVYGDGTCDGITCRPGRQGRIEILVLKLSHQSSNTTPTVSIAVSLVVSLSGLRGTKISIARAHASVLVSAKTMMLKPTVEVRARSPVHLAGVGQFVVSI